MTAAGLITGAVLALGLLGRELAFVGPRPTPRWRAVDAGLVLLALAFTALTVVRIVGYL